MVMKMMQKLYDYIYNMVVNHKVLDEEYIKKRAYKYADNIGLVNRYGITKVKQEIEKMIQHLKDSVRLPKERKVTLLQVYIRMNWDKLVKEAK